MGRLWSEDFEDDGGEAIRMYMVLLFGDDDCYVDMFGSLFAGRLLREWM